MNELDSIYRNPTIKDIASLSGVSIATVSRVLNNRPDVSARTRENVLEHVRRQSYVANQSARSLSAGKTGLIGLVSPYLDGEYFSKIIDGAAEASYARDARLVVSSTHHRHDREVSVLSRLMRGATDGALLILPGEFDAGPAVTDKAMYPIVVIDPVHPTPPHNGVPVVSTANLAGARSIVEHLTGLNHTRIGVITGRRDGLASEQRLSGYRLALAEASAPFDPDLVFDHDTAFRFDDGVRGAEYLLSLPDRPTAIFAFNDAMAVGVLHVAQRLGLRVPQDLSVAGYDNVELARYAIPTITTVAQPLQEVGRVAVDLLYRMIEGRPVDSMVVELSTTLVVGGSTDVRPAAR